MRLKTLAKAAIIAGATLGTNYYLHNAPGPNVSPDGRRRIELNDGKLTIRSGVLPVAVHRGIIHDHTISNPDWDGNYINYHCSYCHEDQDYNTRWRPFEILGISLPVLFSLFYAKHMKTLTKKNKNRIAEKAIDEFIWRVQKGHLSEMTDDQILEYINKSDINIIRAKGFMTPKEKERFNELFWHHEDHPETISEKDRVSTATALVSNAYMLIYPMQPWLPAIHALAGAAISGELLDEIKDGAVQSWELTKKTFRKTMTLEENLVQKVEARERYKELPRHLRKPLFLESVFSPGTEHYSQAEELWNSGETEKALACFRRGLRTRGKLEGDSWIAQASRNREKGTYELLEEISGESDFERRYILIESLDALLQHTKPSLKCAARLQKIAGNEPTWTGLCTATIQELHKINAIHAINSLNPFESIGTNSTIYKITGQHHTYVIEASEDKQTLEARIKEAKKNRKILAPYPEFEVPGYIGLFDQKYDGRYFLLANYAGKPLSLAGKIEDMEQAMRLSAILHDAKKPDCQRNSEKYAEIVQQRLELCGINKLPVQFLWKAWAELPPEDEKADLDFLAGQLLLTREGKLALIDPQDKGTKKLWCDIAKFMATCGYRDEYSRLLPAYFGKEPPLDASFRLLVGAAMNAVNFKTQRTTPEDQEAIQEFYTWLTDALQTKVRPETYERHRELVLALAQENDAYELQTPTPQFLSPETPPSEFYRPPEEQEEKPLSKAAQDKIDRLLRGEY